MIRTLAAGALFFAILAVESPRIMAQSSQPSGTGSDAAQATKSSVNPKTLTGCIQRGDAETSFKLATEDGGVWNLESKAIKFSSHLDHTVKVSGKVVEDFSTKKPEKIIGNDNRRGIFSVSKLTMISTKCGQ
jgi:hypothetical protein